MEAFSKHLAVLVSTEAISKEEVAGLVAYMHQVVRLSRARGFKWLNGLQQNRCGCGGK